MRRRSWERSEREGGKEDAERRKEGEGEGCERGEGAGEWERGEREAVRGVGGREGSEWLAPYPLIIFQPSKRRSFFVVCC